MTTFLGSYERPRRQPLGETSRIGRLVRLSEDTLSAVVELGNEQFELPVSPGKYVLGANVAVLESKGKPRRVSGPAGVWPEGLDADADAPDTVTAVEQLGPVEFTPADQAILDQTVADLAVAQTDLQDAFERIGNIATEVGFAWSGSFEASYPVGSDFRVDWVALGGGEFRYTMVNIPPGANFGWAFTLPQGGQVFPTTNPAIVTATEAGLLTVYAWADDQNVEVDNRWIEVHPAMLDATGPLQAAIAEASAAAVRASRIAPRSLREPTVEDGDNRPTGSIWTQVNAAGEELAYWAWDGTEWVPQALSRQVIPYLDAAHISTGVLDAGRVNAIEVWAEIATIGRIITSDLLATGAVTARTLNVVPEEGTGGMELLPPGLRIIPSDSEAGTAVSLRTDEENWLSFAKNGESTFSVNPDGHLTAQQVDANESLTYRGDEVSDLLRAFPRGVIAMARANTSALVGTTAGRVVASTFRTPAEPRMVRITFTARITSSTPKIAIYHLRQSAGDFVSPTNSSKQTWYSASEHNQHVTFTGMYRSDTDLGWLPDETITVGVFAASNAAAGTQTIQYHVAGPPELVIEDVGPVVEVQPHTPWVPSTGGGEGGGDETAPGKRDFTYQRKSLWVRSFLGTNAFYNYGAGRAYQGLQPTTSNGNLKSMIGWPSLISTLSGATIKSIKIRIKNSHSYAYSGVTAHIGLHGRGSAPATWAHSVGDVIVSNFTRGQTKTLTIPKSYHAGFQSGTYQGISLYSSVSSNSKYGYWDGANAELIIEYEK